MFSLSGLRSQNQCSQWYFGQNAGLNFLNNPPTSLTGSLVTQEGCASVSNAAGSLLFYTDGITIYDATHATMANGSGLNGNSSSTQAAVIVKQPGNSNIYYIFTTDAQGFTNGLCYSIVDMSLAAGLGSVTIKNVQLATPVTEKLASVRHCNGVDIWAVAHDFSSNVFKAYLVNSTGINTTAVTSTVGSTTGNGIGAMKFSPNGQKLGMAIYSSSFELFDFDASTGIVSNAISLSGMGGYGCEFSPDGTKFYGSVPGKIGQWDICAGSATAIAASFYSVAATSNWGLQLAQDGRIYVSRYLTSNVGIINSPNSTGSSLSYTDNGVSISPNQCRLGLPNFFSSYFKTPPTPFTTSVNPNFGCYTASFSTSYSPSVTTVGCVSSGYSLTGLQWNFGDPTSGVNNVSTQQNPIHSFSGMGTYTVSLILYYSCGGGSDTIRQPITINLPCISVNSTSITCANLGSATVQAMGSPGPFSYTWMPTGQTNSVATGLSPGAYTITVHDQSNNFTYTAQTIFTSLIPLTGNINITGSVTCNGAATGTGNITNIAGGSGNQTYIWTNGSVTYTNQNVSSLSAGIWTTQAKDALTGCQFSLVSLVTQPQAMNLVLSTNTPTTCAGGTINLSGLNSGGTPAMTGAGYTYTWTAGPVSNTRTVSNVLAGTYIYTLSSRDSLNCLISKTIAVDFVPNPTISVSSVSICPLQVGTLNGYGGTSYTWNGISVGSSFNDSPSSNTQYTVIGSALSCTGSAVGSIYLKPAPSPFTFGNTTRCQGEALSISAFGGTAYTWSGPLGYNSSVQSVSINPVGLANAGVYQATVTAANSCTAATSATVTINPTPTLSASGSTVCTNQVLNLSSSSLPGSSFAWKGPQSFTSNLQNPVLSSPSVLHSGTYTVLVTSAATCTNTAITQASVVAPPTPAISSNGTVCLNGTLNFNASGFGSGTLTWLGPLGFLSSNTSTQIVGAPVSASGFYTLNVVLGPCNASVSKFILVNPLPSFTMSADNPCEGKDLHLSAGGISNATLFIWQGPSTFTSGSQNPVITNAGPNNVGVYNLTVFDVNGCTSSSAYSVTIRSNPTLTPISTTVCLNEPATLSVTGAQSYIWSGPGSYVSYQSEANIPVAGNSLTTNYTVVGTAVNQCTAVTVAYLSTFVLPKPSITILPTNRFCVGSLIEMQGFGARLYSWNGPGNLFLSGQTVSFTATNMDYQGTYTLGVVDNNGCKGYANASIQLDPLPQGILLGSALSACVPFKSDFNFNPNSPNIKSSWILDKRTFSSVTFSYQFTYPGDYPITGFLKDTITGCTNSSSLMVSAHPVPVADFIYSPIKPIENFEELSLTDNSIGEDQISWKWYILDKEGTIERRGKNVGYTFKESGFYPIAMEVKNRYGCLDSVVKQIEVDVDFTIYVPNTFTPNGDDLNEVFLPVIRGTKFYHMQIFNRWGQLIFSSTQTDTGWDGTYNGKECQQDSYIWKIKLSSLRGQEKTYSGSIGLIR